MNISGCSVVENMSEAVQSSLAIVEAMPEYLVVCCWRSIKEVSLTLGRLCVQIPVSLIHTEVGNKSLLDLEQVGIRPSGKLLFECQNIAQNF